MSRMGLEIRAGEEMIAIFPIRRYDTFMNENGQGDSRGASFEQAYRHHPRHFLGSHLVYPVLSRRSGGVSIGVNLSPLKVCNFHCLYCQVHRIPEASPTAKSVVKEPAFSLEVLESELRQILRLVVSGKLFHMEPFHLAPKPLCRCSDIALSGDGEPTLSDSFEPVCRLCADIKTEFGLKDVKLVLLTNATGLHRPDVQRGLAILHAHNGEVWAKLDAGTERYYQQGNQSPVPFENILENLLVTAKQYPIVIQTLLMKIDGRTMDAPEWQAYMDRLSHILEQGGSIRMIQLHTVARPPRDRRVTALSVLELNSYAKSLRKQIPIHLQTFGG